MKKVHVLLLLAAIVFGMTNCKKKDDDVTPKGDDSVTVAKNYNLSITVKYPDGFEKGNEEITVNVVGNTSDSKKQSVKVDDKGVAKFKLKAGEYNISASGQSKDFALNGAKEKVTVSKDAGVDITLKAVALKGGLVFKEIYYTGSRTPKKKSYYSDQFHEIYNNSDSTIYLDGLCIGLMQPISSKASPWVDASGKLLNKIPLQFHTWYIPGDGKKYPLAPRTSIIIAQDGIDHKTDPKGNPNSPVNLGNADWETYCGDLNKGKDADAPNVPNLKLMYTTSTRIYDWLHSVFGAGVVIFRLPKGTDHKTWAEDPKNLSLIPKSRSKIKHLLIPAEYIIDAVEVVRADKNKQFKRIPEQLDAGKVWCSGTYVSESIRRKVKQVVNGNAIYQDTNNSTNDFLGSQTPTPGVHPKQADK